MKFSTFSKYLGKLERTSSRNEMVITLAELLSASSVKEIAKVCYLCLGRVAPLYQEVVFDVADKMLIRTLAEAFFQDESKIKARYKKLGDLGLVAEELKRGDRKTRKRKDYSVSDIFASLCSIAEDSGSGSQERKKQALAGLIRGVEPLSARYLTRIPLGSLRLGFSDVTVIEALSWMVTSDKSSAADIRRKYNINPNIGQLARVIKKSGLKGLEKIRIEVGKPIRPALSERLPTAQKIVEKLTKLAVEPKMDGIRVQIHITKDSKYKSQDSMLENQEALFGEKLGGLEIDPDIFVRIFSRKLQDATYMFPDIVVGAQKLPVESAILDGEAIAYNPETEEYFSFQETMRRKRKYGIGEKMSELPLRVFVFDLLFLNGQNLLDRPFKERRNLLQGVLKNNKVLTLTRQSLVSNVNELKELFDLYISEGLEGVMCKRLDSTYQAGARNFNWVKYKRGTEGVGLPDTVDGIVMGYYAGKGQQVRHEAGAFMVGVYNLEADGYETIAKVGTGLTDNQWKEFKLKIKGLETKNKPRFYQVNKQLACDVWLRPKLVVEIDADEITRSPVHTAAKDNREFKTGKGNNVGLSLRFPRLVRFRDKLPEDVTTVKEILSLYRMQKQVKHDE